MSWNHMTQRVYCYKESVISVRLILIPSLPLSVCVCRFNYTSVFVCVYIQLYICLCVCLCVCSITHLFVSLCMFYYISEACIHGDGGIRNTMTLSDLPTCTHFVYQPRNS